MGDADDTEDVLGMGKGEIVEKGMVGKGEMGEMGRMREGVGLFRIVGVRWKNESYC